MYCPKCGAQNPEDSHFCESCGSPLSVVTKNNDPTPAPQPAPPAASPVLNFTPAPVTETSSPKSPHQKKNPLVWVIVAVIVLAGLAVGGWFGWNSYQSGQYHEQLSLGEKYLKELNYDDAVVALKRAIEIDPRSPEPYLLLADVYVAQEDYPAAKEILEEGEKATGGNEEIKNKQDEITQKEEEAQKQAEEQKKQEEAEKADAAALAPVVEYENNLYYWQYTSDSVTSDGLFANYSYLGDQENQLVCRDEDGTVTTLYTGTGYGDLLILNDRLYFSNGSSVSSVKLDGSDLQSVEDVTLCAADYQNNYVILSNPNGDSNTLESMDAQGNRITLADGYFLTLQDGVVYYQLPRTSGSNVELGSVHTDGSSQLLLASSPLDDTMGYGGIQQVQVVKDTVYYSYGFFAGTGYFWQGGSIASVKQDGSEAKVLLTSTSTPNFYVYLENDVPILRNFEPDSDYTDNGSSISYGSSSSQCTNLETMESTSSSLPAGNYQKVFYDEEKNFWVYPDTSGNPVQLLDGSEGYESTGSYPFGAEYNGTQWKEISSACYTGDSFYFAVTTSTYDSSLDMGWRSGFRRDLTQWYRKDLSTGETELLYSY